MAKAQYIGVDGVARKVIKDYVGVEGVARNVTKGYIGVDGVARQYFSSSSVKWEKYTAITATRYTEETTSGTSTQGVRIYYSQGANLFTSYKFSPTLGFETTSTKVTATTSDTLATIKAKLLNKYRIIITYPDSPTHYETVWIITDVTSRTHYPNSTPANVLCNCSVKAVAKAQAYDAWVADTNLIDTIEVAEGELPESGTLVEGSATGDYCVLQIGSTYYYYKKVS